MTTPGGLIVNREGLFFTGDMEANTTPSRRRRGGFQLLDVFNHSYQNGGVLLLRLFQLFHFLGQVFVGGQQFTKFDEMRG